MAKSSFHIGSYRLATTVWIAVPAIAVVILVSLILLGQLNSAKSNEVVVDWGKIRTTHFSDVGNDLLAECAKTACVQAKADELIAAARAKAQAEADAEAAQSAAAELQNQQSQQHSYYAVGNGSGTSANSQSDVPPSQPSSPALVPMPTPPGGCGCIAIGDGRYECIPPCSGL
ncbi:MAG: hypothetical protein ACYC6Z_01620 [Thermoleophilia bacterium]